jgi:hypothetical protein
MATFQDTTAPRKRMATYGKTVRRRIPEYSFTSLARKSETPELQRRLTASPKLVPVDHQKLKTIRQRSASRTSSPASPVAANVFDVPSSDDDAAPLTPKKTKLALKPVVKPKSSKETSAGIAEDMESRKKLRLSPAVRRPSPNTFSAQSVKQPVPKVTVQATKQPLRSIGKGQSSTFVARPKPKLEVHQRKPVRQRTPQKPISTNVASPVTPSPHLSDVEMMDVDFPAKYISPRGLQMWKGLLDSAEDKEVDDVSVDDEGIITGKTTAAGVGVPQAHVSRKPLYKPAGVSKSPQTNPRKLPRRRLIDSLVEQTTQQDDTDEESSGSNEAGAIAEVVLSVHLPRSPGDISSSQNLAPEAPKPSILAPGSQGSQNIGPKFTYSRQRSMLAEQDLLQQLDFDMPSQPSQCSKNRRPRRGSIPTVQPLPSFQEENEDTEDGVAGTAIRSVHELRQAGANNRFLDEVEDLLDRVGSPSTSASSMRRSGLLDLASKMKDKNFARQFRANGVEQRLFLHLGQETDLVAGFMMVTLLIALLADASMPHIVAQLRRQGITRLLIRLLDSHASIIALGRERKSNMSKVAQSLLSEHHDFLLQISVWEELKPQTISPRMAALKCLELMVRQTREAGNSGDIFSKELTTNLFSILNSASDESSWVLPSGKQAIDFCLALSALESHSIAARTVHDESIWISNYLPIIADTLEVSLTRPVDEFGVLQLLILRLTLNVTNNNPKASDVFAKENLMAIMGRAIVSKFRKISRFLIEEELSLAVDHLILVLGVMINFAEWSSAARESLEGLSGKDDDPLDHMIQLFVDNQERTSEVRTSFSMRSMLLTHRCRLNRSRKVRRMLHLVISLSFWDIFRCYQVSPSEFGTRTVEKLSGH